MADSVRNKEDKEYSKTNEASQVNNKRHGVHLLVPLQLDTKPAQVMLRDGSESKKREHSEGYTLPGQVTLRERNKDH